MVCVARQPDLLQVIDTLGTTGGFTGRLYGWKQKGNQNGDDRDHDQQFNQRESTLRF